MTEQGPRGCWQRLGRAPHQLPWPLLSHLQGADPPQTQPCGEHPSSIALGAPFTPRPGQTPAPSAPWPTSPCPQGLQAPAPLHEHRCVWWPQGIKELEYL